MDNEKKARAVKNRPVILTKFLFSDLIDALSNCLELNQNLNTLILEGLPISNVYTTFLSKVSSQYGTTQIGAVTVMHLSSCYDLGGGHSINIYIR